MNTAIESPNPVALAAEGVQADDRLLRAREVQRELGISRATAYRLMTDGTLPTYRFGGRYGRRAMIRVSLKELRAWIADHKTTVGTRVTR